MAPATAVATIVAMLLAAVAAAPMAGTASSTRVPRREVRLSWRAGGLAIVSFMPSGWRRQGPLPIGPVTQPARRITRPRLSTGPEYLGGGAVTRRPAARPGRPAVPHGTAPGYPGGWLPGGPWLWMTCPWGP